jgi:hypothetical protein
METTKIDHGQILKLFISFLMTNNENWKTPQSPWELSEFRIHMNSETNR